MRLIKTVLFIILALAVAVSTGCGKKVDPNYKAALDHAKEMSKEEYRSVKTFEMTGGEEGMIIIGVKDIITREPLDPVATPGRPTTGTDVLNNVVKTTGEVAKQAIPVVGKTWLGLKALDVHENLATDNVHIVTQPDPVIVEQPDPIIVEPEPPVIVEPPVVIVDPPEPVIIDPPAPPGSIDVNVTIVDPPPAP